MPRPTRYSSLSLKDIVCLCAGQSDDEAWEEFISRVGKAISLTIMRTASLWGEPSRSLIEDLVQVTYLKLWEDNCRHLRDFAMQYPEAILGYLKKTASNTAHDHFKHAVLSENARASFPSMHPTQSECLRTDHRQPDPRHTSQLRLNRWEHRQCRAQDRGPFRSSCWRRRCMSTHLSARCRNRALRDAERCGRSSGVFRCAGHKPECPQVERGGILEWRPQV